MRAGIYAILIGALIRKYKEKMDLIGKQYLILCFIVLFTTDVVFDNTFLRLHMQMVLKSRNTATVRQNTMMMEAKKRILIM